MDIVYPRSFLGFIELFNAEAFWESHEVLEQPWRENRSSFYQGLIIFASAFVHAQRGNPNGIRKQFTKALNYLSPYTPHYMGIDVAALIEHAQRCMAIVEAQPELSGKKLTATIPFVKLFPDDALVRGDEFEFQDD